eukprot:1159590-Pelagomonas_calceolata.AAC.8
MEAMSRTRHGNDKAWWNCTSLGAQSTRDRRGLDKEAVRIMCVNRACREPPCPYQLQRAPSRSHTHTPHAGPADAKRAGVARGPCSGHARQCKAHQQGQWVVPRALELPSTTDHRLIKQAAGVVIGARTRSACAPTGMLAWYTKAHRDVRTIASETVREAGKAGALEGRARLKLFEFELSSPRATEFGREHGEPTNFLRRARILQRCVHVLLRVLWCFGD